MPVVNKVCLNFWNLCKIMRFVDTATYY